METTMANTEYASPQIASLITNEPSNRLCFDCKLHRVSWASLNNSIFLCSSCVNLHRKLGANVSTVRSLYIDTWTDEQLKYLQCGGNNRLNELLSIYQGTTIFINLVLFYNSKLLNFHRDSIKSEVTNTKCPVMPNAEEAFELSEKCDKNLVNELLKKRNWCSLRDIVSDVYSGIKHKAGGAIEGIKEGTNYAINRTFKIFSLSSNSNDKAEKEDVNSTASTKESS